MVIELVIPTVVVIVVIAVVFCKQTAKYSNSDRFHLSENRKFYPKQDESAPFHF